MKKTAKKPSKIAKKQPKNSARVQSKFDALTRAFACAEFAADGRCSWSNEAFQRAFGYGAEELAGKHQRDLSGSFPPPAWETALASGLVSGEFQFAKKDGSPVWLSGSLSRVGEGKSASVLAIVADSSAAHVARHELELKSLRTQASIDGATTCLMQANERFEIISMNDSRWRCCARTRQQFRSRWRTFASMASLACRWIGFTKNRATSTACSAVCTAVTPSS